MSKIKRGPGLVPNRPTPEGRTAGKQLARLTERGEKALLMEGRMVPQPCKSCAFRRGTLPNGCEETVLDALKCVLEKERVFMCHEVPYYTQPTKICAGYAIATTVLIDSPAVACPWPYAPEADDL